MMRAVFMMTLLCLMVVPAAAQPTDCPGAADLPPRLQAGTWARIVSGQTQNQRAEPGLQAERIGQIPNGDILRVLGEPRCADGYIWWPVDYAGRVGWTAEGSAERGQYWIETLPGTPDLTLPLVEDDPPGCLAPPENYDRFTLGFGILNLRTLAMLDQAQALYTQAGGTIRFRDSIMQGGYNPGGVSASFGTHDAGGAVDLSVRSPGTGEIARAEIPLMIAALREAGFAAWLRDSSELYPGSPIHIHAIAIGDAELSPAAREQIDGTFGYLRGFNGLPQDSGIPLLDGYGPMVICQWMRDLGFDDLRPQPEATAAPG